MNELEGFQRRHLRALAHPLKPVVMIGKEGLSAAVLAKTDAELHAHELIKIRFGDFKDEKQALLDQMAEKLLAEVVGVVGHVGVLFRQNREPKKRKIRVPARPRSRVAAPGGSGR